MSRQKRLKHFANMILRESSVVDNSHSMEQDMDNEFIKDFYEEAQDILQNIYEMLGKYLESSDKVEALNSIARGVHTIKGSCIMFGMTQLNKVSHDLESYMGTLKPYANEIIQEQVTYILRVVDKMSELLANGDKGSIDDLPLAPKLAAISEPVEKIVEKTIIEEEAVTQEENNIVSIKNWKNDKESSTASGNGNGNGATAVQALTEVIRVPVERVNQALDNIWEIFLIRNQLAYLFGQNSTWLNQHPEFVRSWEFLDSSLETNITELESKTMRMRMASLKSIYQRLSQTLRDYSDRYKKPIKLHLIGEEIELDKKIIDILYEPLIHLLRNACDHGIEEGEERASKNKPLEGNIYLSAKIIGNEVIIEIKDDGQGIDPQKLLKKAKEKGLDVSRIQTEKEAIDIIFLAGFSTATEVSEISGRGVGMDAVRTSIQKMGGTIKVDTNVGSGSVFTLTLPLSMSVVSALVMRVNGQVFASTTNPIIETKIINYSDLNRNGDDLYYMQRNNYIKCIDLKNDIFIQSIDRKSLVKKDDGAICLIEHNGQEIALLVDCIEEYYSLVIKPIPSNAPKIPFVLGVSILATGEPIFIISLTKLCEFVLGKKVQEVGVYHEAA
ncbi:MAG: Hpt domain-containing protein [Oligoflexia bacterium]|nr:Hpt domain-containing protein [Oligoflexia bacterium]